MGIREIYEGTVASTTTIEFPDPVTAAGDTIVIFVGGDGGYAGWTISDVGYTEQHDSIATSNMNAAMYIHENVSASETGPTCTGPSTNNKFGFMVVCDDVPTSSVVIDSASNRQDTGVTKQPTALTTTGNNGNLLLAFYVSRRMKDAQVEPGMMYVPGPFANAGVSAGAQGAMAWQWEETGGTTINPYFELMDSEPAITMMVALKSSSGDIPPHTDFSNPPYTVIHPLRQALTGSRWGGTNVDPTTDITTQLGDTLNYIALSINLGDHEFIGFNASGAGSAASNTAAQEWWGSVWSIEGDEADSLDISSKVVAGRAGPGDNISAVGTYGDGGCVFCVRTGSSGAYGYRFYQVAASNSNPRIDKFPNFFIEPGSSSFRWVADVGTVDLTDLSGIGWFYRKNSASLRVNASISDVIQLNTNIMRGGTADKPVTGQSCQDGMAGSGLFPYKVDGVSVTYRQHTQFGDGSMATYWGIEGGAVHQFAPQSTGANFEYSVDSATQGWDWKASAGCNFSRWTGKTFIGTGSTPWKMLDGCSSSATYGAPTSISGCDVRLLDVGQTTFPTTFDDCLRIARPDGATLEGATVKNSQDSSSSITPITFSTAAELNTAFSDLGGCAFEDNPVPIALTYTGTANLTATLNELPAGLTASGSTSFDMTLADGAYDVVLTIPIPTGSGWTTSNTTGGGTSSITFSAPTFDLDLTSNVSSTFRVFTTGTQTQLQTGTGTSLTWTHGNQTVDITCWAAGYQQQRLTNIDLTNANVSRSFELVDVPSYDASHGLTYTTDLTFNRSTKEFDPVTRNEGADFNSALIDAFDAQTALHNTDYPIRMDGEKTAIFLDDAYIKVASLDNWYGAGYEYRNTSDVMQKQAASFKSQGGTWTGATAEYQTTAGTGQTDARATGAIDEVIEIFDIAGSDLRSHWVWKYQVNGFLEARADIVDLFGTLGPVEYEFNMAETAIEAATGDPAVTLTFTDHAATPVTWNGKEFSITIQSNETAETILRELNYNHAQDATYNGEVPFNWWDMVIESGSSYETQRGIHEGGTYKPGTTRKGVRVLNGAGDAHPGFLRFQADDGTYFTPDVTASVAFTGMPTTGPDIRLQIWNNNALTASSWTATTAYSEGDMVLRSTGIGTENTAGLFMRCTTAGTSGGTEPTWDTTPGNTTADGTVTWTTFKVLFYDADPAGASLNTTYTDGEDFASSEQFGYRFAEQAGATSFVTAEGTGTAASSGFSVAVSTTADTVYASNGIDGSGALPFTADYANNELDISADTDFTGAQAYAFFCYELTMTDGMWNFWGGITAIDASTYRINTATLSLYFDVSLANTFVKRTDAARFYRDDDTRPAKDPCSGTDSGVDIGPWQAPVYLVSTGGSALTGPENAKLMSLPSATEVVDEWETQSQADPTGFQVNLKEFNSTPMQGDGTAGNDFRPIGVDPQ